MAPIDLNNLQPREIIPGYSAKFVQSENTTIAFWEIKAGSVMVIPSNVPHSGKPLTDCRIIDVFYPKRKEYR